MRLNRALFFIVAVSGQAVAAELSYNLQSPLIGGNNMALQSAENSRFNTIQQAKARAKAEQDAVINAEKQAAENTPSARFMTTLQSQIFFNASQRIAASIAGLASGASGSFQTGDNIVSYTNNGSSTSVTITTPTGTSVMSIPN